MDIGYQRNVISALAQLLTYLSDIGCLSDTLGCKAHDVASGLGNSDTLLHGCGEVVGRCVGHRL